MSRKWRKNLYRQVHGNGSASSLPQGSVALMMTDHSVQSVVPGFSYEPNKNIRLVLNGGKRVLQDATVPVEWHFSNDLIAMNPRFVIVCDHEESFASYRDKVSFDTGHRYVAPVTDLMGYIQLHKPGIHNFVVVVIFGNEEKARAIAAKFLEKDGSHRYKKFLGVEDVRQNVPCEYYVTTVVEFEVPDELFAHRPDSGLQKAVWNWVNRWHDRNPVDQCDYRKRMIFAFTLQPPFFLIGRLLLGVLGTLYTLIGSFILFFLGWRPIPIWKNVGRAWTNNSFAIKLSRYYKEDWRVWTEADVDRQIGYIPFYLMPVFWAAAFVLLLIISLIPSTVIAHPWASLAILLLGSAGFINDIVSKRMKKKKEETREQREIEKENLREKIEASHKQFLLENASLDAVPEKVDVKKTIRKVNLPTKFVLSFWATKVKVCRPYAK